MKQCQELISSGLKSINNIMASIPYRKLYRSKNYRVIAGICGGLGQYFSIDPTIFRVIAALMLVFGWFSFVIYVILWIVIPLEPGKHRSRTIDIN